MRLKNLHRHRVGDIVRFSECPIRYVVRGVLIRGDGIRLLLRSINGISIQGEFIESRFERVN